LELHKEAGTEGQSGTDLANGPSQGRFQNETLSVTPAKITRNTIKMNRKKVTQLFRRGTAALVNRRTQFAYQAPAASLVALAGDFTDAPWAGWIVASGSGAQSGPLPIRARRGRK
jgi:hypothetical protein